MTGASAVMTVTERSTVSSMCASLAVMPLTQLMRKVWAARSSQVIDWNSEWAMIGSKALSCSCPH